MSSVIPSDLRSFIMGQIYVLPPEVITSMIYPRFWPVHRLVHDIQVFNYRYNY
jgi:hypothetical protein